jgi:hypothetical protein
VRSRNDSLGRHMRTRNVRAHETRDHQGREGVQVEIGNGMTAGEGLLIAGAWGSAGEDSLGYYQEGLGFLIRGSERLDPEQCANVVVAYGLLRTGIVD